MEDTDPFGRLWECLFEWWNRGIGCVDLRHGQSSLGLY